MIHRTICALQARLGSAAAGALNLGDLRADRASRDNQTNSEQHPEILERNVSIRHNEVAVI